MVGGGGERKEEEDDERQVVLGGVIVTGRLTSSAIELHLATKLLTVLLTPQCVS